MVNKITLKAARVNAGISRDVAAKTVGVTLCTLQKWEAGKTYPHAKHFLHLCDLYNISPSNIDI